MFIFASIFLAWGDIFKRNIAKTDVKDFTAYVFLAFYGFRSYTFKFQFFTRIWPVSPHHLQKRLSSSHRQHYHSRPLSFLVVTLGICTEYIFLQYLILIEMSEKENRSFYNNISWYFRHCFSVCFHVWNIVNFFLL